MTAAFLYDATGHDREVPLDEALSARLSGENLLWIDLERGDRAASERIAKRFELDPRTVKLASSDDQTPYLHNFGTYCQLRILTEPGIGGERGGKTRPAAAKQLDFVIGDNWLVTVRAEDIQFLEMFRDQDKAETQIGALNSSALAASLLDWHLSSFFDALGKIETAIDKMDEQTLREPSGDSQLGHMLTLRRQVSRLRALLSMQRGVFYGLSRPDFTFGPDAADAELLKSLAQRFDRAMDEVERGRDLVASSFDLFTSRTTQATNDLVKVLTFVTVITGVFAAVAGLMGMNFDAGLFKTGNAGFYVVTAGLFSGAAAAAVIARRRGWL